MRTSTTQSLYYVVSTHKVSTQHSHNQQSTHEKTQAKTQTPKCLHLTHHSSIKTNPKITASPII